jgi:tetratricopeptide (TPR) repeat protein
MASIFDLSRHISQLKREKKYNEALEFFKENKSDFTNEQISKNEYLISDMVACLRYTSHYDAGFKFLSIYDIEINSETNERILNSYGWLLWSKYKSENSNVNDSENENDYFEEDEETLVNSNFHYDKNELIQRIEVLIPILLSINNDYSKTLTSNLFSIVLKSEKKKPTPNWKLMNDFCNNFNPENLSTECSTIQVERKGQLKDMELASDMENWFAYKTKSLLKIGEWQECFDTSKKALETIESFHYSNDVWFARRIALAKKNLGNTEETINELQTILRKKKEWFVQKELSELYFEKEDFEKAFKYSIDAITNFGPIEFKVDLLYLLGRIHKNKSESELAFKHFSLSKLIREKEEWKVPQKLFDELNQFEQQAITVSEINKLKSDLNKYWNSFKPKQKNPSKSNPNIQNGEVVKIMHDNERGKDGFLKCDGTEYYFSLSANYHLTPKISIGSKVGFKILSAENGKKEQTRIIKLNE